VGVIEREDNLALQGLGAYFARPFAFYPWYSALVAQRKSGELLEIGEMKPKGNAWNPTVPPEESPYNHRGDPILKRPLAAEEINSEGRLPTLIDLFSGAGGFSVGFERAGFKTILGLDVHRAAAETFMRNFPRAGFILGDARRVSIELVLEATAGLKPDVITAGVPCQGFSLNNRKRHADDQRNYLFLEVIRFAEALRPKALVIENVPGMASARKGGADLSFVHEVASAIEELGYEVSFARLNAANYGVPQTRERVFFVGTEKGLRFEWPRPLLGPFSPEKRPYVSVWEAIGDLPPLEPGESKEEYTAEAHSAYARLMRAGASRLFNHEAPFHDERTLRRIASTRPGEPLYETFRQRIRLDPNRPSPTVIAGGIRPQFLFAHPFQNRGLTVRERARLQSFPDTFVFEGGMVQGRVLTGNAVPPLLAEALALAIRRALDGDDLAERKNRAERTPKRVLQPPLFER
jgi:DNA (cytosine-5)-methyltransferase 1